MLIVHIIQTLLHISFTFLLQMGFVQHENKQHLKEATTFILFVVWISVVVLRNPAQKVFKKRRAGKKQWSARVAK